MARLFCIAAFIGCALSSWAQTPTVRLTVNAVNPVADEARFLKFQVGLTVKNESTKVVYLLQEGVGGAEQVIVDFHRYIFDQYLVNIGPNRHGGWYSSVRKLEPGEELKIVVSLRGYMWRGDPEEGVPVSGKIQAKVFFLDNLEKTKTAALNRKLYWSARHATAFFTVRWPPEVVCSLARYPDKDGKCSQPLKRVK